MNKLVFSVSLVVLAACQPLQLHNGNGGGNVSTGGGSAAGGGSATGGGTGTGGGGVTFDGGTVTWYKNVLPITQQKCAGCHTAGGIGPFALDSYTSAKPMAAAMSADVQNGKMPPWMPAASCGMTYVEDRRLSADAIAVIKAWAEQGAPEGDPADAPAPLDGGVGQLAWVDQTVMPAAGYMPSATETDDYHCSLIDPTLASDRFVVGYQVLPQSRAEVHHVILYAVKRADAQAKNAGGQGWQCFGGSGIQDEIFIGGWAPGSGAVTFPSGTGIRVPSDYVYVMQVHYNTTNGRSLDQTAMQLQYANTPVLEATVAPVLDYGFNVPAGAMGYTPSEMPVMTPNPYGVPIRIWGVFPHMHTHGTHINVTSPDGCLIDIPNWDFHWQQQYFFSQPVTVQPNAQVGLSCTWNNTTNAALHWGEGTADEMCLAFLYMTQ